MKLNFYCFYCGHVLKDNVLGSLVCENCKSIFIPFIDRDGNQNLLCAYSE